MGHLVLTRHVGEKIYLKLNVTLDTDIEDVIRKLVHEGITLSVKEIHNGRAAIGIDAPREVRVLRAELVDG